jgi:hypothetical protein
MSKGPGVVTLGDGIFGLRVRHSPPLDETLTGDRILRASNGRANCRFEDLAGDSCRRLKKMVLNYDR